MIVERSGNYVILLFFGQVGKVYAVSGNTNRQSRILFRMLLRIKQRITVLLVMLAGWLYAAAIAAYMKHKSIPCTGCSYCVPCPYGVRIPEIFAWYNEWAQNGRLPADEGANATQDLRRCFLASYYNTFRARERADRCLACRKCLVPCPQWTFRIPTEMEKVAALVAHVEEVYVQKGGVVR